MSSRFAIAAIADEAIVLDLRSGDLFRASGPALLVVRKLARGVDAAAKALVHEYDVPLAVAKADVRALVAKLSRKKARSRTFVATKRGYVAPFGLAIDRRGRIVPEEPAIRRVLAPHALALAGERILHASAVETKRGVVAFLGPSGIGKTTIARARPEPTISEDLVVLRDANVVRDGEARVHAFASLDGGGTLPLRAIFVVERGKSLSTEPLEGARAVAALFANAFVELPDAGVWIRALATCRALAARGIVHRLVVPEGLARARRALRAWKIDVRASS